jgi:glucosamine--fructose-6-phosphate aminotransferase (isomerizing)
MFLAISQSGRSDDLIEQTISAKRAGALTVVLVNDTSSPLAQCCDIVLPMSAGTERSVAATKSFVATLTALLRVVAAWVEDTGLAEALARLPNRLTDAAALDWSSSFGVLAHAASMITIGRGPTLAIAGEAALKLKETCHLHAEAFSGAEFQHGPVSLVEPRFPILMFMPADAAADALRPLAAQLRRQQAALFVTENGVAAEGRLPVLPQDHPETDAICLIQSLYGAVVTLAALRGRDADRPAHLQKVTRTR